MNAFEFAPAYAQGQTARRRKMSREAAVAVGVSIAVHLGVVGYIATQKFDTLKLMVSDAPITTTLERLPPKPPEPPRPDRKDPEPVQKKIAIHAPETPPLDPPVDPIAAEPQPKIAQTDPGPPVIPQTKEPVQLADNRRIEPPRTTVITNPSWARRPSGAELGRLYPRRAQELGLGGGATILCEVIADGSVRNCAVIDESPKGKGFGDAALASAKLYKLNPRTVDGQTVEGARVRIPLVFNLAD